MESAGRFPIPAPSKTILFIKDRPTNRIRIVRFTEPEISLYRTPVFWRRRIIVYPQQKLIQPCNACFRPAVMMEKAAHEKRNSFYRQAGLSVYPDGHFGRLSKG